jgi:hypothetical protein
MSDFRSDAYVFSERFTERNSDHGGECPGCGRIMSRREAAEQGECNDCHPGGAVDSLDADLIDYARSQWDGRPEGPRTEYD